ncbi:hypothetical protein DERP_000981 [Dermatophagoides pteronyssinus]|uniref:Uncharacterized protein n=1 Tax=Dermatophagoides pteronyssinus TaxID=6956 RepID=A0ABQ8JDP1_DERPT|nr:hypothetical protein DERP_000981 [Dermatophagoides pteronyssinus]
MARSKRKFSSSDDNNDDDDIEELGLLLDYHQEDESEMTDSSNIDSKTNCDQSVINAIRLNRGASFFSRLDRIASLYCKSDHSDNDDDDDEVIDLSKLNETFKRKKPKASTREPSPDDLNNLSTESEDDRCDDSESIGSESSTESDDDREEIKNDDDYDDDNDDNDNFDHHREIPSKKPKKLRDLFTSSTNNDSIFDPTDHRNIRPSSSLSSSSSSSSSLTFKKLIESKNIRPF